MPGSNLKALWKAQSGALPADSFILDLEDAVAPDAKAQAREQVAAMLAQGGFGGKEVAVRVNGMDTSWGPADLLMARQQPLVQAIVLPKVCGPCAVPSVPHLIFGAHNF